MKGGETMTTKDVCNYIEILDYIDYRIFIHKTSGNPHKRFLMSSLRYRRHKMHALAIDMILRGDY